MPVLRQCIVCGQRKPKAELWRMTRKANSSMILWDEEKKLGGYGIYLCPQINCANDFLQKRKFKKRYHPYLAQEIWGKLNFNLTG